MCICLFIQYLYYWNDRGGLNSLGHLKIGLLLAVGGIDQEVWHFGKRCVLGGKLWSLRSLTDKALLHFAFKMWTHTCYSRLLQPATSAFPSQILFLCVAKYSSPVLSYSWRTTNLLTHHGKEKVPWSRVRIKFVY